jgi:hypothetical protein
MYQLCRAWQLGAKTSETALRYQSCLADGRLIAQLILAEKSA